jgi:LysM repeat protein
MIRVAFALILALLLLQINRPDCFFYYEVQPGDTLWGISRTFLGAGRRYHEIVALNSRQILNPGLIFPGQVFVVPDESPYCPPR